MSHGPGALKAQLTNYAGEQFLAIILPTIYSLSITVASPLVGAINGHKALNYGFSDRLLP